MSRRIITAREQVAMLSPWSREAFIKVARYPQEWRADAPYGRFSNSGRARNRPPSVRVDPDDRSAGIIDPSDIRYELLGDSVSAYHPNGAHLGNYSWEEDYHSGGAHIGIAQVHPKYQGQGVAGGIIDHIRENYQPELVHSGHRGVGSLSYQGRAGALRDLGNTEEEHNDYFNTIPFNHGSTEPAGFGNFGPPTEEQRKAHLELMQQFEEDKQHPNWTGRTSDNPNDPDLYDYDGDRHEYGYDHAGDYVGLSSGGKDYEGYSEEGYDHRGYDREGFDIHGFDDENYDQEGFHESTGLNRDGETRHGYTPGDGTPPEGTVPMSQMASHWAQNGLLPQNPEHEQMMDDAANLGVGQTMYAVRRSHERSNHTGEHHVGNGDTLYSSLERARQVAYHPNDPSKDMDIVSADWLDPDYLHTDASGATPEDFHYAPVSGDQDAEDTASTPANIVHDPQRHQRILGDLGRGWSKGNLDYSSHPSFEYTDPDSGRGGRMWQENGGMWRTEHQPQFGTTKRGFHHDYRAAADAIHEGTLPGPPMEHHALEVNNDYEASGRGEVDWEPHPNGQGLMARTPHGDLHLIQDPSTGQWDYHAGPHGSQPGDEGNMHSMLSSNLSRAAAAGVRAITRTPFHGGLRDELGEGWSPHPTSQSAFTRRLPSGNHAYIVKNPYNSYTSGIQRDNGGGQPHLSPLFARDSPNLAQAKAFIHHRENPVPASEFGEGWEDYDRGPRAFPAYIHEGHPSGAIGRVVWTDQGGWRGGVSHGGNLHRSNDEGTPGYETPHEAAAWANSFMDSIGK